MIPFKLHFIAKKSLFGVPLMGQALHTMGAIPIDRGNLEKAKESLGKAADYIIKNKKSVSIAPEGTRRRKSSDIEPRILPFKKGPIYFDSCFFLHNKKIRPFPSCQGFSKFSLCFKLPQMKGLQCEHSSCDHLRWIQIMASWQTLHWIRFYIFLRLFFKIVEVSHISNVCPFIPRRKSRNFRLRSL